MYLIRQRFAAGFFIGVEHFQNGVAAPCSKVDRLYAGVFERIAQRAGYRAQATAYLTMKGETEKIELKVGTGESVLTDEHQLREALSQALGIAQERIVILVEEP